MEHAWGWGLRRSCTPPSLLKATTKVANIGVLKHAPLHTCPETGDRSLMREGPINIDILCQNRTVEHSSKLLPSSKLVSPSFKAPYLHTSVWSKPQQNQSQNFSKLSRRPSDALARMTSASLNDSIHVVQRGWLLLEEQAT